MTVIENGADVNAANRDRKTPLHVAVMYGRTKIVETLINFGAKVNKMDRYGTPLHLAAYLGCIDIVKHLIEKGADVNTKDNYGKTPLHVAINNYHYEAAKLLVDAGAYVNIKDHTGKTPLDIAIKRRRGEMIKLLIKHTLLQNPDIKPSGLQERDLAYWKRCEGEIRDMKEYELDDGVSLFDIFIANDKKKLALHMSNEKIVEALRPNVNAIREKFSIYAGQIEKQCLQGLDAFRRKCAVEKIVRCVSAKKQQNFNIEECEKDIDKKGLAGLSEEEIAKKKQQEIDKKGVLGLNEYPLREATQIFRHRSSERYSLPTQQPQHNKC